MKYFAFFVLAFINFYHLDLYSQSKSISIITKDRDQYIGDSVSLDSNQVILYNKNEKQKFLLENILDLEINEYLIEIENNRKSMFSQYYLLGESALPGVKGNIYFRNYGIFDNRFILNFSRNFSLEIGNNAYTFNTIEYGDGPFQPYIGAKLSVPIIKDVINIGGKVTIDYIDEYGYYFEENQNSNFGNSLSTFLTLGNQTNNVTFGVKREGFAYHTNQYFYFWAANVKSSQKTSLIFEYTLLPYDNSLFLFGLRHNRKSISYNFGLGYFAGLEYYDVNFPLPYFGVTVPISTSKL